MLKKFILRNFKNFQDTIEFDFDKVGGYKFNQECVNNNIISKSIIYGRNATGKTNLGEAFGDIIELVKGDSVLWLTRKERILNANSQEDRATFSYEFAFDSDSVIYTYQRNNKNELCTEALTVNSIPIFKVDFEKGILQDLNLSYIEAETIQLNKYTELIKHSIVDIEDEMNTHVPFLRFILNNAVLPLDSVLLKLEDYVQRMRLYSVTQQIQTGMRPRLLESFTEYLSKQENLIDFEQFLNTMGIECKLRVIQSIEGHYELFFDYENPVPFYKNASSGTLSLVNFYRRYIVPIKKPSFIYMDEFDAFYHYEMAEKLVNYFKLKYPDCQVVLTTHNTNLMTNQLMRPDCLFILSRSGKLTALCDATERELREGHNLEKLYIGGEFEQYE